MSIRMRHSPVLAVALGLLAISCASAKVVDLVHNPDGTIQAIDPFVR